MKSIRLRRIDGRGTLTANQPSRAFERWLIDSLRSARGLGELHPLPHRVASVGVHRRPTRGEGAGGAANHAVDGSKTWGAMTRARSRL